MPSPLASHWQLPPDLTFLNHGSFGATPRRATEAQARWLARLERNPIPGFRDWVFDPDDLSEGLQRYIDSSGTPPPLGEPGTAPPRLTPPLRWVRESRAVGTPSDDVWTVPGITTGVSGVLTFMVEPGGEHGFDAVAPEKTWDEGEYLANVLGWYFRSGGRELLYHSQPSTHHCLENSSCTFDR